MFHVIDSSLKAIAYKDLITCIIGELNALKSRTVLTILLISVLSLSSFSVFPTHNNTVTAQSSGSCPSNEIFRMTWYGGAPSSLASLLTVNGASGIAVSKIEYWGISPAPGPTGARYYNLSLVDWVESNANNTQWTVNIRPGLMWSNGQPVTSQDILATYSKSYAFNPSLDFTGMYKEVTDVVALNRSAVQFDLNTSNAYFLDIIGSDSLTNVLPAADANVNYTGFGTTNVVVGPFYAVNYVEGQTQMVMDRNPYFYTTGLPEPKICQIDLNFVESTTSTSQLLASGSTDFGEVDPSTISSLTANHNIGILAEPGDFAEVASWNVTAYPFNMTAFRQAIVYAVNESQSVTEGLSGFGSTAYNGQGGIPPFVASLYNPEQVNYSYNPKESISLLQSIGINKGSDGYLQYSNGTDITINLWVNNQNPQDLVTGKVVQTDLQNLGFKVTINPVGRSAISRVASMAPATMYIITSGGVNFPDAYFDAQPGWINALDHPAIPSAYWEYPPTANNEYFSNLSAFNANPDLGTTQQYLNNIQALNAKYLPAFIINYESVVFGYSTQDWTNWGTYPSSWVITPGLFDAQLLAELQPVSGTTSSSTTTPITISSPVTTSTIPITSTHSTAPTTTSATSSTTTSSAKSSVAMSWSIIGVVLTIILAAAALLVIRRRPAAQS